jgi:transposase
LTHRSGFGIHCIDLTFRAAAPPAQKRGFGMTVLDFERLVRTEHSARLYLLERCESAGAPRCPACSREKLYVVEGGKRRRCARCGHTFNPFAGRWLNAAKIGAREWLWLVKLFELEAPATVAAAETGVSYPTVLKAIGAIRRAIAGASGPGHAGCGTPRDRMRLSDLAAGEDGPDRIEAVAEERIAFTMNVGDDCLIMTNRRLECPALVCCGRKLDVVDRGNSFPRLRVYCSAKGFWPFAKERLVKYHGVSSEKLPWYLEEMAFRWNGRGTPLFESLLDRLCAYAPAAPPGPGYRAPRSKTSSATANESFEPSHETDTS